jgi:sarcosine oxidase subunit beta
LPPRITSRRSTASATSPCSEKGWLGGGNTGRNTTIVRSNYHLDANAHFYELSLKLWERLSRALNFNVMYSARGVLNLVHTPGDMDAAMRRGNAMRLNGIDAQFLSRDEIAARIPNLDCSPVARFPILGGLLQPRGGTVRHDAVAWGYARAADALGVDILQQCEVTGIRVERGAVTGVRTTRGDIGTSKIGIAVAGHSSQVAAMAGIRLPIESHVLQAMVSEPVKPFSTPSSRRAPSISTSASPTRASSSWEATSISTTRMRSAAACRRSRKSLPRVRRSFRASAGCG